MNPLQMMEARLNALRAESQSLYEQRGALIDKAASEQRGMTADEKAQYDDLSVRRNAKEQEIPPIEERIAELKEQEERSNAAAASRVETGQTGEQRTAPAVVTKDEPVYVPDGSNGVSYWQDMVKASNGDQRAIDRLRRNTQITLETRALGNTNAAGGSGGEFAPPGWAIDEWIAVLRTGRVTANLFNRQEIPDGVSSWNLPKVATGTTVALQSTQNTALSQTDLTTGYVQTGFATLGGKQVVSQQLLDQSAIGFDRVVFGDLAAAYNQQVGTQVLTGAGNGSGTNATVNGFANASLASGNAITWTQASPTVAGFYGQSNKLLAAFLGNRLAAPTAWIMHPRRWYWLTSQVDSNGRPLVVPVGQAFNTIATMDNTPPQGLAGYYIGLPVYIDPSIPTNLGAGTNQDIVYLVKEDDLWLFESAPRSEVFREPYADSVGVLFRMYGYVGTILNRYSSSIGSISGTGLVPPVFAS